MTSLSHKRTNLSLSQEKEELIKGLEVLESTRQWFSDRIEQVTLEEKQLLSRHGHSHEVRDVEGTCNHSLLCVDESGGGHVSRSVGSSEFVIFIPTLASSLGLSLLPPPSLPKALPLWHRVCKPPKLSDGYSSYMHSLSILTQPDTRQRILF